MIVRFTKKFEKQLLKQPVKIQKQLYSRIDLFIENQDNLLLKKHALKGKYLGLYSINVSGDVRALYYENGEDMVFFAFIGTHSQLY
jgi:addiction module RelE/StbE family toxin